MTILSLNSVKTFTENSMVWIIFNVGTNYLSFTFLDQKVWGIDLTAGGTNLLLGIFTHNCMKMKHWTDRGGGRVSFVLPRFTTATKNVFSFFLRHESFYGATDTPVLDFW